MHLSQENNHVTRCKDDKNEMEHKEATRRRMIETALSEGASFTSAAELLATIYGTEAKPGPKPKSPKGRK